MYSKETDLNNKTCRLCSDSIPFCETCYDKSICIKCN